MHHSWFLLIPLTAMAIATGMTAYMFWYMATWDERWEERRREGRRKMRALPLFIERPINRYREWCIGRRMVELTQYSAESARNYVVWGLDDRFVVRLNDDFLPSIAGALGAKVYWKASAPDYPEPLLVLEVVNRTPEPDGSLKHYLIRCDPRFGVSDIRTLIARTFGFNFNPEEYKPLVET